MTEQDYTSLAASKRLMEAGIKLETDAVWFESLTGWIIAPLSNRYEESIPAYSFTTLWRELPEAKVLVGLIQERDEYNSMGADVAILCIEVCRTADALADLLIWVTERKEKKV